MDRNESTAGNVSSQETWFVLRARFCLGPADEQGHGSWILHTGSSGTMFWCDRQRKVIGVIATQHRYSDGEKMPESEKKDSVGRTFMDKANQARIH